VPELRSALKPPTTGGRLVYAVGDIHGYSAALRTLLADIAEDAEARRPGERPLLVFIGDYVDRGPDSKGAIDLILEAEAAGAFEVAALKGNHEDALERFLAEPAYAPSWIGNWGQTTLISYGIVPPDPLDAAACQQVQARFAAAFPDAHRSFLGRLSLQRTVGDYLFVHAGVRPGVALEEQADRDLIWIRYDFLESEDDFGKVVVHGHTPSAGRPEIKPNRINVDTGVYFSGLLTAVRLEGEARRFIQAAV
jgi:serine/threonine protein phosphatase 1